MNFCLGGEYLLPTKFATDHFFTDKVSIGILKTTEKPSLKYHEKSL